MVLLFQFASCSTDSDLRDSENSNAESKQLSFSAGNNKNPMEKEGKKYSKVLAWYLKTNKTPNSISELISQIHFVSKEFCGVKSLNKKTPPLSSDKIKALMDNPGEELLVIIDQSTLGTSAKSELLDFVQTLIDRSNDDYSEVYLYITSFEDEILQSTSLISDEKNTILTISSLSRYVLYEEARKDRDWETSVGNRISQPFFGFNQAAVISLLALLEELV
jgi:hypothetical protein